MKIIQKMAAKTNDHMHHEGVTIAFLGDSVTQGCFEIYKKENNEVETVFDKRYSYEMYVFETLNTLFPVATVNIINAGISGDNAQNGRKRLSRDILPFQPDLVVVCFGLNDVTRGMEGLPLYAEALDGILKDLSDAGIETIFMTPNMIGTRVVAEEKDPVIHVALENIVRFQTDGTMDAYMAKAREVCAENHVPVCDCYAKWKKLMQNGADVTRLLANRVNHPTENMHWLFAASLFEMIMGVTV